MIKVHTITTTDGRVLVVNPGTDGVFVVNKPTCVDDYGNVVSGAERVDDTYANGPTGGYYNVFGGTAYGDYRDAVDLDTDEGRAAFMDDDCGGLFSEGFLTIYDYLTGRYTALADLYSVPDTEEYAWARQ